MRKYCFLFIILILSTGSSIFSWVTFYGKKPVQLSENTKYVKIYWNAFSNEIDVTNRMDKLRKDINQKENFFGDTVIYMSDNDSIIGHRIYVIRFFRNENDMLEFVSPSATRIDSFQKRISTENFNQRWNLLKKGMKIKTVFKQFPELLEFKSDHIIYYDSTAYKVGNIELDFNRYGRLDTLMIKSR